MPDLGDQLRALVDGAADPVTLDEVRARAASHPTDEGGAHDAPSPQLTPLGGAGSTSGPRVRWLVAAAVLAVVALAGVLFLTLADGGTRIDVGDTTDAAGRPLFELLELRQATDEMGTLRSAVTEEELITLWGDVGFDGVPPSVDMERWVVVSITIPDDACPPALGGFDRTDGVWTPQFVGLDEGCATPLVPKTYVVAIDRAEAAPGFTLRLPAELPFPFDEERLEVDVPPGRPTGPDPQRRSDPGEGGDEGVSTAGPPLATLPLPRRGEARSHLLDDGSPVWVVHHADGSATAVPAVIPPPDNPQSPSDDPLDAVVWSVVRWSPEGAFRGPSTWDPWGRALTAGRHQDLAGYEATVEGNDVVVRRAATERVPGSPVLPDGPVGSLQEPDLPTAERALDDLPAGWHRVDAAAVGAEGALRICEVSNEQFPPSTCPSSAPVVAGVTAPFGMRSWHFAPLLVRVDSGGRIDAVVPLGGWTVAADP